MMKNMDVRMRAKQCRVTLWEIADRLGICDITLNRRLRHELPEEQKQEIFAIIEKLRQG